MNTPFIPRIVAARFIPASLRVGAKLTVALAFLLVLQAGFAADRGMIHERAEDVVPLLPGMEVGSFTLRDPAGDAVAFSPEALERPLVVTFYRGGWCPYCNLHLAELRTVEDELAALGYELWFVSLDRPALLREALAEGDLEYRLLSDAGLEASRAFGIAFRVDDETYARYAAHGLDLEERSGETHHVLPAPSTFIVGEDGVIRFQYTNPDYTVRLHPQVLLAAARADRADADRRLRAARERGD